MPRYDSFNCLLIQKNIVKLTELTQIREILFEIIFEVIKTDENDEILFQELGLIMKNVNTLDFGQSLIEYLSLLNKIIREIKNKMHVFARLSIENSLILILKKINETKFKFNTTDEILDSSNFNKNKALEAFIINLIHLILIFLWENREKKSFYIKFLDLYLPRKIFGKLSFEYIFEAADCYKESKFELIKIVLKRIENSDEDLQKNFLNYLKDEKNINNLLNDKAMLANLPKVTPQNQEYIKEIYCLFIKYMVCNANIYITQFREALFGMDEPFRASFIEYLLNYFDFIQNKLSQLINIQLFFLFVDTTDFNCESYLEHNIKILFKFMDYFKIFNLFYVTLPETSIENPYLKKGGILTNLCWVLFKYVRLFTNKQKLSQLNSLLDKFSEIIFDEKLRSKIDDSNNIWKRSFYKQFENFEKNERFDRTEDADKKEKLKLKNECLNKNFLNCVFGEFLNIFYETNFHRIEEIVKRTLHYLYGNPTMSLFYQQEKILNEIENLTPLKQHRLDFQRKIIFFESKGKNFRDLVDFHCENLKNILENNVTFNPNIYDKLKMIFSPYAEVFNLIQKYHTLVNKSYAKILLNMMNEYKTF